MRALTVHTLYLSIEMKSESKIHVLGKSKRAERVRRWTAFFEQAQFNRSAQHTNDFIVVRYRMA